MCGWPLIGQSFRILSAVSLTMAMLPFPLPDMKIPPVRVGDVSSSRTSRVAPTGFLEPVAGPGVADF